MITCLIFNKMFVESLCIINNGRTSVSIYRQTVQDVCHQSRHHIQSSSCILHSLLIFIAHVIVSGANAQLFVNFGVNRITT